MRPTPDGLLPAQAAILILGCLFVSVAALWLFVITKAMIAIGIGAVALFTAGACAFAHRHALKPEGEEGPAEISRQGRQHLGG